MCYIKPEEIIVTYPKDNRDAVRTLIERYGYRELYELSQFLKARHISMPADCKFTSSLVIVPSGEEFYAVSKLMANAAGMLLSVEPNLLFSITALPGVTRFSLDTTIKRTYNQMVNAHLANRTRITGQGVTIAVLDTGIENASTGVNLVDPPSQILPKDDNGHGTAVASMINDITPNATIMPIKIANKQGISELWWLECGLFAAQGSDVTNVSMAYGLNPVCLNCKQIYALSPNRARSYVLDETVKFRAKDALVVASTGNEGWPQQISHPAACPDAVAVASVDSNGQVSAFSNVDPNATYYLAPGGAGLPHAQPTEYVGKDSQSNQLFAGTSMAAAYASGVIALLIERAAQGGQTVLSVKSSLRPGKLITF